jgi:hypothetical protein
LACALNFYVRKPTAAMLMIRRMRSFPWVNLVELNLINKAEYASYSILRRKSFISGMMLFVAF